MNRLAEDYRKTRRRQRINLKGRFDYSARNPLGHETLNKAESELQHILDGPVTRRNKKNTKQKLHQALHVSREPSPLSKRLCEESFYDMSIYSEKLEERTVQALTTKVKALQEDLYLANMKFNKSVSQKQMLYSLNEKLKNALKKIKTKLNDMKRQARTKKKCSFCNNELEISFSNIAGSLDRINIKAENASFMFNSAHGASFLSQK